MGDNGEEKQVRLGKLQHILAGIWGAIVIVAIVLLLALHSRLGEAFDEGCGWYAQTFLPLLSIIVTGYIKTQRKRKTLPVSQGFAIFTCIALGAYGLIALSIPFCDDGSTTLMQGLNQSSMLLGPLQAIILGLVAFSFGQDKNENQSGGNNSGNNDKPPPQEDDKEAPPEDEEEGPPGSG